MFNIVSISIFFLVVLAYAHNTCVCHSDHRVLFGRTVIFFDLMDLETSNNRSECIACIKYSLACSADHKHYRQFQCHLFKNVFHFVYVCIKCIFDVFFQALVLKMKRVGAKKESKIKGTFFFVCKIMRSTLCGSLLWIAAINDCTHRFQFTLIVNTDKALPR